jgi:hypothetical protein
VTDLRDKLRGYFRVASIQHYLIVDPDKRIVIHHARGAGDVRIKGHFSSHMINAGWRSCVTRTAKLPCGKGVIGNTRSGMMAISSDTSIIFTSIQ